MKFLLVALILALTAQEIDMADPYRFVPEGGASPYDAGGTPKGLYYPKDGSIDFEGNVVGKGLTADELKAQGLTGENPWYIAPDNSGTGIGGLFTDAKGFLTDTGGAGGLIAAPFIGAGLGEAFGAGAGATDWGGGWDAFGSTGGEGVGFGGGGGGGGGGGDLYLDELTDTTGKTYNNVPTNTGNPADFAVPNIDPATGQPRQQQNADATGAFDIGGSTGFGGSTPMSAASSFSAGGSDGGFLGGFEDLAPGGESGSPVGNDPNVPTDEDELRRRAAQSLAKPPDVTTAGVPSAGSPTGAPTAPTAGAPAAGSGAAPKSFIQKAIDSATNSPLSAASLGFNLYKQSQASKNGQSAQAQLQQVAQPASDASKKLIEEGLGGNVPAPILTQFNKTAEQQKAAIDSRYANMGRDPNNDSSAAAEKAKIDEARDAQIANYASTLLQQGLTAAGVASAPATQAILAGVNQDKEMQNAMAQMLQQMAFLESMRSSKAA